MKVAKKAVRSIAIFVTTALFACNQGPVMRGQIAGLSKLASQAERNGAIRCAPRELALAKAHLKFAEVELDQGFLSRANHHLAIAEPNAHAAYDLSPPETCAERGLVIETVGPRDEVLKLLPPLVIADEELGRGLDILEEALEQTLLGAGVERLDSVRSVVGADDRD